jgi:tripartite-type tricarboxylate transporter receptor subunit TctC
MSKEAGRGGAALVLLAATLGGLGPHAAASAQEWEPEFVYGVLQPLPDGFPKGPITIVAAGDETSVAGLLAQRLSEYSTIYRPVDIKVEYRDLGKFGNWEALKYAAGAEGGGEGYINVIFASPDDIIGLHTTPVAAELGAGLDDLAEVVTLESHRYALIQCKEASWEPSWQALVEEIRKRPGEIRYAGGDPGDRVDLVFAFYMHAAGLGSLYDKSAIGHASVGDVAQRTDAVAACDADVTVTDMEQLVTRQMDKKVDVIFVSGDRKLGKVIPASAAGIADDPMSRSMQVVVPAGVDPLHVKWLSVLLSKVGTNSYFKAGRVLDQVVNIANVLGPEESAALNDTVDARMAELTRTLGIAVPPP